jgi:galactokinase/mevalonate kinase-like predicted kinase
MVQQNSSNYTDVQIKNTGNKTLNVTFRIDGINSTWYSLNDTSEQLYQNNKAGFRITFAVGSEDVKDYQGTYTATSTDKTINQNFTLRVMPAPGKKIEINDTFLSYKTNATALEVLVNQSRDKKLNVTLAEQKLAELKAKITQAENYIASGDYFNANQLFDSIKKLIDDINSELSKAKEVKAKANMKNIWIFVGIAAGLIVVGVLAYMFWPVKGKPTKTYLPSGGQ